MITEMEINMPHIKIEIPVSVLRKAQGDPVGFVDRARKLVDDAINEMLCAALEEQPCFIDVDYKMKRISKKKDSPGIKEVAPGP